MLGEQLYEAGDVFGVPDEPRERDRKIDRGDGGVEQASVVGIDELPHLLGSLDATERAPSAVHQADTVRQPLAEDAGGNTRHEDLALGREVP